MVSKKIAFITDYSRSDQDMLLETVDRLVVLEVNQIGSAVGVGYVRH
jgi:hypothetical protein